MKTQFISWIFLILAGIAATAQPIPADSIYLGQTPPGTTPKIFPLPVSPGSFDAERITISDDNTEIYYSGIDAYYPTRGDTIKYYRFAGNAWTGPFNLFPDHLAPALSKSGDTLFYQDNNPVYATFFSVRNGAGWSETQPVCSGLTSAHYLQETGRGNFFISSVAPDGLGGNDWCRLRMTAGDTSVSSLGIPVCSSVDNLDFFVARDESFLILVKGGLRISYHREDGGWTNPKSLGQTINFGMGMWGPLVTPDNRYLFYTTGIQPDYSDTHVYWVRIDGLIDSLKHSNFIPYLKNPIPPLSAFTGRMFFYDADSTFLDDDGNNTLSYSVKQTNGNPLPDWLSFDTTAVTFSGVPQQPETLKIWLKATDDAGASTYTIFTVSVGDTTGIDSKRDHGLRVFPNPNSGRFRVSCEGAGEKIFRAEIRNMEGTLVRKVGQDAEGYYDLSGVPKGIYILKAIINEDAVYKRICIL
jgi:hypothetical protein